MIKFLISISILYILYQLFVKCVPSIILKTKSVAIQNRFKFCFVTHESIDYISIYKKDLNNFIFIFPGFASDSLYLHKQCKLLFDKFGHIYNIIGLKYQTNYNRLSDLSEHIAKIILMILNSPQDTSIDMHEISKRRYTIHVIGCSYGCSVAISTFIKLQCKYGLSRINTFTSYKSYNTFERAIRYQDSTIVKLVAFIFSLNAHYNNFSYNNNNIRYVNAKNIYVVNHVNDEIINKNAQFSNYFCKLNNIHLIYDTHIPSKYDSYFEYFFKCHTYFNIDILSKIIK